MNENHIDNFRRDFHVLEMHIDELNWDSVSPAVTFKVRLEDAENLVKDNYYWRANFRSRSSEIKLREQYPTLKIAYEKYQTLLALVQDRQQITGVIT